jgi:F-type H+-transporting ATPase subunit delta
MAEIATIARPYAEALYKAVKASPGAEDSASAWVDELAAIAGNPQLLAFSDNPKTTSQQLIALIGGLFKTSLPVMGTNFLSIVIENGRLNAMPEIASQFRALINAQSGSSDAVVYSAFPIEPEALAGVVGALEKRFARKLNVSVELQPDLIGGIRVVVGDEVLDTSVKARLEQMKVALTA